MFAEYGNILRVRLRFQQSNLQQKDSVYIEFADTASAAAAVASPPLQPGSSSKRLECLHKQEYEKQQHSFLQTSSLGTSTGKRKQGSTDSTGDNAANFGMDMEQSRKRSKISVDKAKRIDELQLALQKEQAESARLRAVAKQVCRGSSIAMSVSSDYQISAYSKACTWLVKRIAYLEYVLSSIIDCFIQLDWGLSICRLNRKRLKLSTRQNKHRAN